jgi:hypothetical protein
MPEKVLREELRKAGERWQKKYKTMGDKERLRVLGCFAARRLIADEVDRRCRAKREPVPEIKRMDPELIGTQGPLGHDSGGGNRVLRSTKSLS